MLKINMESVQNIIQEVAETCIVPRFQNLHVGEIQFKGEDDPVTIADKEAELALKERLLTLLPGSLIVGEEEFASDSGILSRFSADSPVWVVDPVDGTKAFMAGEPFYGVIVALTKQNQTLAGWLYDPTSKEFITAEKGAGAYYKGRRLKVLPPAPLPQMQGVVGQKDLFESTFCQEKLKGQGAPLCLQPLYACHDFARLSVDGPHFSGQTEQMHFHSWPSFCSPWDGSAGILIHAEAGGYTAHWDGQPFLPCHYKRGLLSAPDAESWQVLRDWMASLCAFARG